MVPAGQQALGSDLSPSYRPQSTSASGGGGTNINMDEMSVEDMAMKANQVTDEVSLLRLRETRTAVGGLEVARPFACSKYAAERG